MPFWDWDSLFISRDGAVKQCTHVNIKVYISYRKLSPHERGRMINYNQGACIKGPLSRPRTVVHLCSHHPGPVCSLLAPCPLTPAAGLPLQIMAGYRSIWTPHDVPVTKGSSHRPQPSIIGNNETGGIRNMIINIRTNKNTH